jgi:hypothetical protein
MAVFPPEMKGFRKSGSGMRIFQEYPEIWVFPVISGVFQSGCSPFEQKLPHDSFYIMYLP